MSNVLMIESCEKKTVFRDYSNTSMIHVRNSMIMEKEFTFKLITHQSQISEVANQKWDHIICHYASPYMKYKAYLEILDNNQDAKLWFLVNDFDIEDNILLRNFVKKYHKKYNVICNNPRSGYRHWILAKNIEEKKLNDWLDEWFTLNLNCLIFNPSIVDVPKKDIIYYGTFRKHRAEDMSYFNGIDNYYISSSAKNQDKYKNANIQANFIDRISWTEGSEDLKKYKYSIYFEDNHTHNNYAFLANRFYECLMCDVILFFDKKCLNTVEKAREQGYFISEGLIVENAAQINAKMKYYDENPNEYLKELENQRKNSSVASKEKEYTLEYLKGIFQ